MSKEIAWRWQEFSLFIQTYEEYFELAKKKNKEVKEDDGLTYTPEDLLDFDFLGFIVHETEVKEVKEEEDEEAKEENEVSSFTLPPSLVLELESLGFADGVKKEVRDEKKEQREKMQEEEDDDGYYLIWTPEEELELDLLDFIKKGKE